MKTIQKHTRLASFATSQLSYKLRSWRTILLAAILLLAFTGTASAGNLSVGSSEGFTSIQAAIDNASDGDTIYVASGEYIENIVVNKKVIITSENGSSETSIIAADAGEHVIYVTAGNVTIDGFNISGSDAKAGIYLDSDNNTLSNNQVSLNEYGIRLYDSQYNVLRNNSMYDNTYNFGVERYYGVRNDIDTSNTVDGKPIYYLVAVTDMIIDEDSNAGTIYCIGSQNITIKNVTLSNNLNGIYFHRTSNSRIENVQTYGNRDGIALWYYSNNNVITNSVAEDNDYGIAVRQFSEDNILNNNAVSSKGIFGIQIYSDNTQVVSNNVSDNNGHGIALASNNNKLINNLALNNRWNGIYLKSASYNAIEENTVNGNGINGLFLLSSDINTLTDNTVMENDDHGIYFNMSHNNEMKDNIVSDNVNYGFRMSNSTNNLIYNNLFNNTNNVVVRASPDNEWNTAKKEGTSIVGGDFLGGNYWAKPDGTGFSQTELDDDGDGIIDTAYLIGENATDYLPLSIPAHYNLPPVATIVSIGDTATVGETLYFEGSGNDTDGTVEAYMWNSSLDGELSNAASFSTADLSEGSHIIFFKVQDNEGAWSDEKTSVLTINAAPGETETDTTAPVLTGVTPENGTEYEAGTDSVNVRFDYSDEESGIYISSVVLTFDGADVSGENSTTIKEDYAEYSATNLSAGTYTATVYVEDIAGNDATFNTQFTIAAESSSSSSSSSSSRSSSSGGGGGGGSTSGEKYENIQVKEVMSIFVIKDSHITYKFSKEGNPINSVEFDSLKNSGTISATVEVLKGTSSYAKATAPETVYKQMNIWLGKSGFTSSENVEKLLVTFKVEKSWMEENNIEAENVVLYRYVDSEWTALPTTVTSEDDTYVYFKGETTGFSAFAISGEATPAPAPAEENADTELYSVEDTETLDEELPETNSESAGTPGSFIVTGIMAVVLAGGYILYRKKD